MGPEQSAAERLLACASRLAGGATLELACARHPEPAAGQAEVDAVLVLEGCLAALGPSAHLGLVALGAREVRARLDACAGCPLVAEAAEIAPALQQAQALLLALGRQETVAAAPAAGRPARRPVISARQPPVSRRAFFQAMAHRSDDRLAELLDAGGAPAEGAKGPPPERRRLLAALRALEAGAAGGRVGLAGFTRLAASQECTACEACARVCPTGALVLERGDGFRLAFRVGACTNCGLCLEPCAPGALSRDGAPTVAELLATDGRVLRAGALRSCRRCAVRFAGPAEGDLCPACAFRRANPFGAAELARGQDGRSVPVLPSQGSPPPRRGRRPGAC